MTDQLSRKDWGRLHIPNCILHEVDINTVFGERTSHLYRYAHHSDFGGFEVEGLFIDEWLINPYASAPSFQIPELGKAYTLDVLLESVEKVIPYGQSPLAVRLQRPKLILNGNVLRGAENVNLDPPRAVLEDIVKDFKRD